MLMPPQVQAHRIIPHYLQIYGFYKEMILNGSLTEGSKLPSIRALAQHLGVSRNPVETAYAHLLAEGYIVNKPRSGYCATRIERLDVGAAEPISSRRVGAELEIDSGNETLAMYDFRYDVFDAATFPDKLWKSLTLRVLRQASEAGLFSYGHRNGELRLREHIAAYLREHRAVSCTAEQIIVTSGTQQAMLMISLLLRGSEKELAIGVEAAMHPGIYQILQRQGLRPHTIALEHDGMNCDELERCGQLLGVYVTPSHQFPYGMTLSASKRQRLLQWAAQSGAIIVEDDYDSEFIFEGGPLPSLQGLDRHGSVIYMGSFSKVLAPGIRLGYIVLPPPLQQRFEQEMVYFDQSASRLVQKTMELFMEQGHLQRHHRRMKKYYRMKRDKLLAALKLHLGSRVAVSGQSSGLHVVVSVQCDAEAVELLEEASAAGVSIAPIGEYDLRAERLPLRFVVGFGGIAMERIEAGVQALAQAWAPWLKS